MDRSMLTHGHVEPSRGAPYLVFFHLLQDEQFLVRNGSLIAQLSLCISQPVQQLLGFLVELVSLHKQPTSEPTLDLITGLEQV